jgi:hypothetical protein
MTKSAYLRVYAPEVEASMEPVPAFVRTYGLLSEEEGDAHWTADWDGKRLVCPRNLRLRVLESTVAFANAFQGLGVGLIPEDAARAADHELRAYHRAHPEHRSHVLTSAWHVPVRWFTAFDPSQKQIYEEPNGMRLRFRSDVDESRRRVNRAYEIIEKLDVFPGPAEELGQLGEWLGPFPSGSMVELDYGDVADLFESADLVLDNSCELIQESLDALEAGDMMRAGENYGRVVSRWAPAFSVTFSN